MPALNVNEEQLRAATAQIYGISSAHAPRDVWIDHFDLTHSYIRALYTEEFCGECARRLLRLAKIVRDASGNDPDTTICIYVGDQPETIAEERQAFVRNRLAGFKRGHP